MSGWVGGLMVVTVVGKFLNMVRGTSMLSPKRILLRRNYPKTRSFLKHLIVSSLVQFST